MRLNLRLNQKKMLNNINLYKKMEQEVYDFEQIRPYNDEEVRDAINSLIADPELEPFFRNLFPIFDFHKFKRQLKHVKSVYDFQSIFAYSAMKFVIEKSIDRFSVSGVDELDTKKAYLFITNHRDIVLDSSLMNFALFEKGHNTAQTAIGDNLFISPMITHLLKLNKSFTVKRNIQQRAFYDYSKSLSAYISHTIKDRNQSIWIAQREGRAKDGNDKTQYSLLKMLMMNLEKSEKESFFDLNILPVAISYEYDPCDVLKAIELYMNEHEMNFEKTRDKDMRSMVQGLMGDKGNVHVAFGSPLGVDDNGGEDELLYNDWVKNVADKIDLQIYTNYRLWNSNYIAFDILYKTKRNSDKYSDTEKKEFLRYLNKRAEMAPEDFDKAEIVTILLTMYSNPVKNHLLFC